MSVVAEARPATPAVAAPARGRLRRSGGHAQILLVSFAALLAEVSYTRIISYKLFYYYVYIVIGLALLGIGAGGVLVTVSRRLREAATGTVLYWSFFLGAAGTLAGYFVIAACRIDTLAIWEYGTARSYEGFALLLVTCLCVCVTFVPAGVVVATLLGRRSEAIGGLYFADLAGAGLACVTVVALVSWASAPAAVMAAVLVMSAVAAWEARRMRRLLLAAAIALTAAGAVLVVRPSLLPAQQLDTSKLSVSPGTDPAASSWGPVFRVDAVHVGQNEIFLFHDGIFGAAIYRWDGRRSSLARYDFPHGALSIPLRVLDQPAPDVAVIGAAGGHEVLAALSYGARHVDAVELNPVTVRFVSQTFAGFDGHLAQDPAVTYTNADGRSFIARTSKHYQLVWYPAPDSYAATNGALSSAYVLSESYLYTVNGIQADLAHLTAGGVFVAQFGEVDDTYDLRTLRLVATARQALANLGVPDASGHVLVAISRISLLSSLPLATILVSRSAFTPAEIARFDASLRGIPSTSALYSPDLRAPANPVQRYLRTPNAGLPAFYAGYPFDVTPTTDDDPFFYHFARYGSVLGNFLRPLDSTDRENAVGERVLLLLLALSVLIAVAFLLLPFVAIRREWRKLPAKKLSAVFFAGVGFGFIFFEITLMQMLNLFLGYPTYALTVVLAALLVFSGLGALASSRVRRRRRALAGCFAGLAGLTAFYLLGLGPATNAMMGLPLPLRIAVAVAVLAPLGLCLGMFMPIGLGEITGRGGAPRVYVAWGWAVNGFASVVGSAGATVLAMILGFDWVLFLGACAYLVAVVAWAALTRGAAAPATAG